MLIYYSLGHSIHNTFKYRLLTIGLRITISSTDDSILNDQKVYIFSLPINQSDQMKSLEQYINK